MSKPKFKVGDKVRAISKSIYQSDNFPNVIVGKIYEVEKKFENESIILKFDESLYSKYQELALTFEEELFELVEDTPIDLSNINDWRKEPLPYQKIAENLKFQNDMNKNMGIRLNKGKDRWRNFPMFLMEPVIKVGSHAEIRDGNPNGKYETFNFLKGMHVNDCLDSLKRHLVKFESPYESDNDEETSESHLAHIAWNALVALHMLKTRPELDDRYKLPKELTEEEKLEAAEEIQRRGR